MTPPSRDQGVIVPRAVLGGLIAACAASVFLNAWLLGRDQGRAAALSPATVAAASAVPTPLPLEASPIPLAPPAPAPPPLSPPPPFPSAVPGGTPGPGPAPPAAGEAAGVARYFAEVDALQAATSGFDDPQQLALSLVGELASGDTGGIDRLLAAQIDVERRMRAMSPPAACAEHHRRSLELLATARRLLDQVQRGAASGDLSGVAAAAADAQRLEAEARELERLDRELRARYGVAAAR